MERTVSEEPKKEFKTVLWENLWYFGLSLYNYFIRATLKWFLHVFTGKSELERIVDRYPRGSSRCEAIAYSLTHSKRPDLRQCLDIPEAATPSLVALISKVKYVSKKREFEPILRDSLSLILGYRQVLSVSPSRSHRRAWIELVREVEWARKEFYSSDNPEHEALLMRLWEVMQPGRKLSGRKSKDWTDIGFQGQDPATDFRGMGILGLQQLMCLTHSILNYRIEPDFRYLFEEENEVGQRIFSISNHPVIGFPFAIASITITAMVRDLLRSDALTHHVYNTCQTPLTLHTFHQIYGTIIQLFCEHWVQWNPSSVMEYNVAKGAFEEELRAHLALSTNSLPTPTLLTKDAPST